MRDKDLLHCSESSRELPPPGPAGDKGWSEAIRGLAPWGTASPTHAYLEGSDTQLKQDLVLGGDADGKHSKHHIVDAEQRDEQQGGLGQPPGPGRTLSDCSVTHEPPATAVLLAPPQPLLRPPCSRFPGHVRAVRTAQGPMEPHTHTHLYCDWSLPLTSGDVNFCSKIRIILTKRTKLTCTKKDKTFVRDPSKGELCGSWARSPLQGQALVPHLQEPGPCPTWLCPRSELDIVCQLHHIA